MILCGRRTKPAIFLHTIVVSFFKVVLLWFFCSVVEREKDLREVQSSSPTAAAITAVRRRNTRYRRRWTTTVAGKGRWWSLSMVVVLGGLILKQNSHGIFQFFFVCRKMSKKEDIEGDLGFRILNHMLLYYQLLMTVLIECLPDAVAIRCLARVPYCLFPKLETICHAWRDVVRSTELFKAREEVKSTEDFLCVCAFDPENVWQLYDPSRVIWITLHVLPSKVRNLAHFGVVSTAGKLFVLGGGSDVVDPLTGDQDGSFATNEVWAYDPILQSGSSKLCLTQCIRMFQMCLLDAINWIFKLIQSSYVMARRGGDIFILSDLK